VDQNICISLYHCLYDCLYLFFCFSLAENNLGISDAQFAVSVEFGATQIDVGQVSQLVDAGFYIDFSVTDFFKKEF